MKFGTTGKFAGCKTYAPLPGRALITLIGQLDDARSPGQIDEFGDRLAVSAGSIISPLTRSSLKPP